ncbi:MAG: hypothetical protein ACTHLO_04550 [Pseudolabrys sp.]
MFNRKRLTTSLLGLTALAIAGTVALPAPASAAKISAVLGACKRTAGCNSWSDGKGWAIGCGPHGCFECDKGKCHSIARSAVDTKRLGLKARNGNESTTSHTWSKAAGNRDATANASFGASVNHADASHMRMGGKH